MKISYKMSSPLVPLRRPKIDVLGVGVDDFSQKEAVDLILKLAQDTKNNHFVVTVNPEFVMKARKNRNFAQILEKADLALADGWGVALAKLLFGGRGRERVAGVDLVEKLCFLASKKAVRVGFLGGFGRVAQKVAERQKSQFPNLKISYVGPGNPAIGYDSRLKKALDKAGRVGILFVAYGMGQQEFWIARNLKKLNVAVFIGVGGAFDYISRVKRRAPQIFQKIGMEWFWRLLHEPQRILRMRVLPIFAILVILNFVKHKITHRI